VSEGRVRLVRGGEGHAFEYREMTTNELEGGLAWGGPRIDWMRNSE
jgi:hypothetical protein